MPSSLRHDTSSPRSRSSARQRRPIGRTHARRRRASVTCERPARDSAHGCSSELSPAAESAAASSRPSTTASAGSTRMFQTRTSFVRQVRAGRREQPLHRARIAGGDRQRRRGGELAQPRVAARRHLAQVGHRVELDVGLGQAVQARRSSSRPARPSRTRSGSRGFGRDRRSWRRHPVGRLRPARPEVLAVLDASRRRRSRARRRRAPARAIAFSWSGSPSARRLTISSPSVRSSASRCGDLRAAVGAHEIQHREIVAGVRRRASS